MGKNPQLVFVKMRVLGDAGRLSSLNNCICAMGLCGMTALGVRAEKSNRTVHVKCGTFSLCQISIGILQTPYSS